MRVLMHYRTALLLLALLSLSCVATKAARQPSYDLPPNMSIYAQPLDLVWQRLLTVLRTDMLYNLQLVNARDKFFTTEWVVDDTSDTLVRFRLSGTLKYEDKGTVVVLYRQIEVKTASGWSGLNSDYSLEHFVLNRLQQRLRAVTTP